MCGLGVSPCGGAFAEVAATTGHFVLVFVFFSVFCPSPTPKGEAGQKRLYCFSPPARQPRGRAGWHLRGAGPSVPPCAGPDRTGPDRLPAVAQLRLLLTFCSQRCVGLIRAELGSHSALSAAGFLSRAACKRAFYFPKGSSVAAPGLSALPFCLSGVQL